jgi:hypothetical protein
MVICNRTDLDSFNEISSWHSLAPASAPRAVAIFVVGTMADWEDTPVIARETAESVAADLHLPEMRVIEQRVMNLKRKLDFYSDPANVWALYGRNLHTGGGKKGAVMLMQAPEAKNLHYLTVPPLMGPYSARRKAATKRSSLTLLTFG